MNKLKRAKLILEDGTIFEGTAFGANIASSGEVVFATGMTGYDLSLTDPSYKGQILAFTYPLIGNWGVPKKEFLESSKVHVSGLIVSGLDNTPNHHASEMNLNEWLIKENVPAISGIDTRTLTIKLRERGTMIGKITNDNFDTDFIDPQSLNLVSEVSPKEMEIVKPAKVNSNTIKIALLNCGAKNNIIRCLIKRNVIVYNTPWDFDPFENNLDFDGFLISNGPGDPKMATKSISIIKKVLAKKIPTFGICLGNQLLTLAAGGETYKLKFGHRSQNQPTIEEKSKKCYITTQNHGYAVNNKNLPDGFRKWFTNANDNSNEGIIHDKLPFFSVQFHPEAMPGPTDTEFLFDYFLERIRKL